MHTLRLCLLIAVISGLSGLGAGRLHAETVRLKATADIGVSSMVFKGSDERVMSWGLSPRFKLKSIQEMGVIRFDASPARGREVLVAWLFLHRAGPDRIRYVRVSTVNGDWEEGKQKKDYGPPSGACFNYADWDSKRLWAWPGSQLCDVILGAGYSRATHGEVEKLDGGWLRVKLTPELVYAMCADDTDGLAVQEGGDLSYFNNFIHSVQSGRFAPYLEADLGAELAEAPAQPVVSAAPAEDLAGTDRGALRLTIDEADIVFCWRIRLNGQPVPRWQLSHPAAEGPTVMTLKDLHPSQKCDLEIVAVSRGGGPSVPTRVSAKSSSALPVSPLFGELAKPKGKAEPRGKGGSLSVWACPGAVKIDPVSCRAMFSDTASKGDSFSPNAVWDGKTVHLFGCRGEYVSFQLVIEQSGDAPLGEVRVTPAKLAGPPGSEIASTEVELYRNWYAKNRDQKWQPAYCVPLKHGEAFRIPDPDRGLEGQRSQTVYVDVYIPKDARPGKYVGPFTVLAGDEAVAIPIETEVYDFLMPDKLAFRPQLNCYSWGIPRGLDAHDIYRLAHQHRCVFFYRAYAPRLSGRGEDIAVHWEDYDKRVAPLLSGDAFRNSRRASVPIELLALPFQDSWPTPLTRETYRYRGRWILAAEKDRRKLKELHKILNEHYLTSPYIGDGLTQEYKDAFAAVQRQFILHFRAKGWDRTEVQCLFMGKKAHRIRYRVNMWWTTDEPYHFDDWLALQFFARLWSENRGPDNARQWVFRADISRPQWQGTLLDGIVDNIHFGTGAFSSPAMYRRCRGLARRGGFDRRVYGSVNQDSRSNLESVVWVLNAWLHGASAALPWQTMGKESSLDVNDSSVGGNALFAPGKRFGCPVVADLRVKALRDAEQLIEYLVLFADRYNLTREQVKAILYQSVQIEAGLAPGAGADNADALRFNTLKAWQLSGLRRRLADLIVQAGEAR